MDKALLLTILKCFSRKTARALLARIDPGTERLEQLVSFLESGAGMGAPAAVPPVAEIEEKHRRALQVVAAAEASSILLLDPHDPAFPRRLAAIPDPPLLLYVRGNASLLNRASALAVVGTREPSGYGIRAAEAITSALVDRGYVIVSGLAAGCDTAAHWACLRKGGSTVAVLPGGADMPSPRSNRRLYEEILKNGGCIVSEYRPGERPRKYRYIKRDRLQSGLSLGIVVIETEPEGGTMHTVRYAREQGRRIACVASHPPQYRRLASFQGNALLLGQREVIGLSTGDDLERYLRLLESGAGPPGRIDRPGQPELF